MIKLSSLKSRETLMRLGMGHTVVSATQSGNREPETSTATLDILTRMSVHRQANLNRAKQL